MRPLVLPFVSWMAASAALAQEPPGLEDLFSRGFLLEDRNGDGLTDFVNAWLVLGEAPSPAVVAAASDVAAQLGFETMHAVERKGSSFFGGVSLNLDRPRPPKTE